MSVNPRLQNMQQTYHLHYDQVGTLRVVTNAYGQNIKEITYDTFGHIRKDTNPSFKVPFGFAGGLYDVDTKLTRFGYRDYDAYTGKWTAKDPIGFDGGDSNLYGYVLGDPVSGFDPSGEVAIVDDVAIVCIAALGAWAIHEATPHIKNLIHFISCTPPNDPPKERDCNRNRDGCPEIISECVVLCTTTKPYRSPGTPEYNYCMARCVPKRCHGYHEWGQPPYSN